MGIKIRRVLIVGVSGMLGHQLLRVLSAKHKVLGILRRKSSSYNVPGLFTHKNTVSGVDIRHIENILPIISGFQPDVVVNAAGIIKQREEGNDPVTCIEVNALFPHRLSEVCAIYGAKLIHFSTDCVFSGTSSGLIPDGAVHDASDIYGKTKSLGEVSKNGCLTLRTSMIGLEIENKRGLIEWFLSQKGTIKGYTHAIFSGLTTMELARVVIMLLESPWKRHGVYNVGTTPISKYNLLKRLNELTGHRVVVDKDECVVVDRSLDSSRFRADFKYTPPCWENMLRELATHIKNGRNICSDHC